MKLNSYCFIFGAALVLAAGCKKAQNPSDVLAPTKNGVPTSSVNGFPIADAGGRVVAFDDDDGTGLSNLLCYDLVSGSVNLVHVSGGTLTNVWAQQTGFVMDNAPTFHIDQATWDNAATDNYNEVGGVHVTAMDLNGSGHQDHIVVYIPGKGIAMILQPSTSVAGEWHMVWPTNGAYSTSGIAGYDLKGPTDKILAYGINSASKNGLVVYRPGNGFFWVLQNQSSTPSNPDWVAVVKRSNGLGNFSLSNANDQIIVVDYNPSGGEYDLLFYRPGQGDANYFSHTPNTPTFTQEYTTAEGLPGAPLNAVQDRIMPYDANGSFWQNYLLCFAPGGGANSEWLDAISGTVAGGDPLSTNFNYPLNLNPYPSGTTPGTGEGDKFVAIQGNAGLSTLVCYQNGNSFAQIWEESNPGAVGANGAISYTQVY